MDKITRVEPADIEKVRRLFKNVVAVLTAEHADTDGRAGAAANLCAWSGEGLLDTREGTAPEDKFDSYVHNALNKVLTLLDHPEHRLSFESHNMETGPYPGGARFPTELILAISGFTWQEDEVGVLWIGYKMGWIELKEAMRLVKTSQESASLFVRLFRLFNLEQHELASIA